ncbi:hypothetical protein MKW98_005644, partial [Papaver atlanticum]
MALTAPAVVAEEIYDRAKEVKDFNDSKLGVKGLLDSGITSIPRFFIHPPESLPSSTPTNKLASNGEIPTIDLSAINTDHRSFIVDRIKEASCTWGFFQVINQPRRSIRYTQPQTHCMGMDHVDSDKIPEILRSGLFELDQHIERLGETLMEIWLGLEKDRLKKMACLGRRHLPDHYNPHYPEPNRTMGTECHTDPSVFTALLQDQIGRLQVNHGEHWVDVKRMYGALVLNIGDVIQ